MGRLERTGNPREQRQLKGLTKPVPSGQITAAIEDLKGERWEQFSQRHGDWGRDAALYPGRRHGRLSLAALGELSGGVNYVRAMFGRGGPGRGATVGSRRG